MAKICLHCLISGRVQGVYYRDSTRREAKKLEITGWVRNLDDGRVEALLCGEEANVQKMRDWLQEGPPAARVTDVETHRKPWEKYEDFEVR